MRRRSRHHHFNAIRQVEVLTDKPSFFAELKRRNVLRAPALYIGLGAVARRGTVVAGVRCPNCVIRWFVIAALVGFPLAMLIQTTACKGPPNCAAARALRLIKKPFRANLSGHSSNYESGRMTLCPSLALSANAVRARLRLRCLCLS